MGLEDLCGAFPFTVGVVTDCCVFLRLKAAALDSEAVRGMLGPTNASQRSRTYYVPVVALSILRMTSLFHSQVEKQTLIYSRSQGS